MSRIRRRHRGVKEAKAVYSWLRSLLATRRKNKTQQTLFLWRCDEFVVLELSKEATDVGNGTTWSRGKRSGVRFRNVQFSPKLETVGLIADIGLPSKDGYQLIRRIRIN